MSFIKKTLYKYDVKIFEDLSALNIRRMYLMGIIMGIINIVHIVVFWINITSSPKYVIHWHYLIIFFHAIMFLFNSFLGFIAYWIEKNRKQGQRISYFIQGLSILTNLLIGISLCVSDQLVTTNINPLLTACIGVGVIFLIPPIVSAAYYIITFLLFFSMVTWTQTAPDLLEHVRINSLTATGMGFGVSWILWRNHFFRAQQQKIIEEQKRELEEKNEYLHYLAIHDPLSGLFTRGYFTELVNEEIIKNMDAISEACIILLDLDYFKKINDRFGHPAGDQVIKETAKIISYGLRQTDVAARLGGEEFIILLPETNLQTGKELAENLRRAIQDYGFEFEGKPLEITASLGVARLTDTFDTCYRQADDALYASKKRGRNCVEVFVDSLITL
ncbi:GGDEF domain-containing protein [Bacillus sp. T3]|uniref:GGDEF domain-containing protein n=1 Tax=Bacillus sp. T3 TaxID=467262 RepID=UPI002980CA4D|nr:GGDEF domain-containing protein [Bacillus sp. T3]